MINDSFSILVISPVLRHLCQNMFKGTDKEFLHIFNKIAGKPSGPEADVLHNSSIASIISFSVKLTSVRVGM